MKTLLELIQREINKIKDKELIIYLNGIKASINASGVCYISKKQFKKFPRKLRKRFNTSNNIRETKRCYVFNFNGMRIKKFIFDIELRPTLK